MRDRLKEGVRICFDLIGQARPYRVSWEEIAKWLEQISGENHINPNTLSQSDSEVTLKFSKDKKQSVKRSQPLHTDRPQPFDQRSKLPNADCPQTSQPPSAIETNYQPQTSTEMQPELPQAARSEDPKELDEFARLMPQVFKDDRMTTERSRCNCNHVTFNL